MRNEWSPEQIRGWLKRLKARLISHECFGFHLHHQGLLCSGRDLSGIVIYGSENRVSLIDYEICDNRESGIFVFASVRPYISGNFSYENYHFGIAVWDHETCPDLVRNICRKTMLSGFLLFH